MSEVNLNVNIGVREWAHPVLESVGKSIQERVGSELDEKSAIEMINEVAVTIAKHATFVDGPIYLDPYNHNISIKVNRR